MASTTPPRRSRVKAITPSPDLSEARRLFDAGLKLVPLLPESKRPEGGAWNLHPAQAFDEQRTGYGLLLAANGLVSIDPDHEAAARAGLAACGFDLDEIMAAGVQSASTRPDSGGRSTFRDPGGLRWLKFSGEGIGTMLELRATSANLQDVIPGLVYRDKVGELRTQHYVNGKTLRTPPPLPKDFAEWWQALSTDIAFLRAEQDRFAAAFGVVAHRSISTGTSLAFHSDYRTPFNSAYSVPDILDAQGYKQHGDRWESPEASGAPGIREIKSRPGLWQSDHASDPLFGTFDAWTAFVVLEHAEDVAAAEAAFKRTDPDAAVSMREFLTKNRTNTLPSRSEGQQETRATLKPAVASPDPFAAAVADPREQEVLERGERLEALLKERGAPLDLSVFKTPPAGPQFVWGNYMSRGTVTVTASLGGLGKSQVGLGHALHAACGLGFLNASTSGGQRVWYVSLEDSRDAVEERIYRAAQAIVKQKRGKAQAGMGPKALHELMRKNFRYVDLYGSEFRVVMKTREDIMPTPDPDVLAEYIEAQGGADVVYIDTLIRSHSVDENANDQMARVLVSYEGFARRLNAGVCLLAHVPKARGNDRSSHAARGAGATVDNARSAVSITAATADDVKGFANIEPEWVNPENPRLLRITHGKSNYAGKMPPAWALLREGWVETFTPVLSKAGAEERLYIALQAWWADPQGYGAKPLAKSAIEARLEGIKDHSGKKEGRRLWSGALQWGIDNGHALVAPATGDNPSAVFYVLNAPKAAGVPDEN